MDYMTHLLHPALRVIIGGTFAAFGRMGGKGKRIAPIAFSLG